MTSRSPSARTSSIAAVAGEETNIKLTTSDDFAAAEKLALSSLLDVRTGTGFDAHRFGPGDHVWLCGVKIPHSAALVGHSDADVGLHALTDAILGALGAADIGAHFPPSEERWRGAPSHLFLEHAAELVRKRGGFISHVDVTLICERPKIAPHRETMRARIAEILRIDIGARQREGDHQRRSRLHRPERRHRRAGRGDDPASRVSRTLLSARDVLRHRAHSVCVRDVCVRRRPSLRQCCSRCAAGRRWRSPLLVAIVVGIWACGEHAAKLGVSDPSECVLDEVAGQWIALMPIAFYARPYDWPLYAIGFFLFRLFDIAKFWPMSAAERLAGRTRRHGRRCAGRSDRGGAPLDRAREWMGVMFSDRVLVLATGAHRGSAREAREDRDR